MDARRGRRADSRLDAALGILSFERPSVIVSDVYFLSFSLYFPCVLFLLFAVLPLCFFPLEDIITHDIPSDLV